ncbi:MAG: T9SS type A sorting domain-containing protein, partial [candidate division WOR-3 bacterium]
VSNFESYEDCYLSYSIRNGFLNLHSKNKQDIYIKIYSIDGKLTYKREFRNFEGVIKEPIKLGSGVYIVKFKYINGEKKQKVIIR